jgi:uncharacterized protein YdhG (YjbR/CyaY superfamily)
MSIAGFCSIDVMRTKRSRPAQSAAKRAPAPKSVDEYLERVPDSSRSHFNELRAAVREAVPQDAIEVISYGIPAFKQQRVLVWFAAFAAHCSLFPTAAVIEAFQVELQGYTVSKGTVQFPLDKPLPRALVKQLVKARIKQSEAGKRS